MKKILVYGLTHNLGGIESFLINYYRLFDRDQLQLDFLTYSREPCFADEIETMGGKIIRVQGRCLNPIKLIRHLHDMIWFFSRHSGEYTAIWCNQNTLSDINPILMAKLFGISSRIMHSHSSGSTNSLLTRALHTVHRCFLGWLATDVWACSDLAGNFFRTGKKPIVMIPNAIDTATFVFDSLTRARVRRQLNAEDRLVLGHVGRFDEGKNHRFLIEIFQQLIKLHPNALLWLVGQGEERPAIERLVEEKQLLDSVRFLGVRDDVRDLYMGMDAFVLPSLYEGLGIVLIEAQTAGLPCFASWNAIPAQAKVTELLAFISLSEPAHEWARRIAEGMACEREDMSGEVDKNGFNILSQCHRLQDRLLRLN